MVAFLDIMGYREALMSLDVFPLPTDGDATKQLELKMVRVVAMRQNLVESIARFMKSAHEAPSVSVRHLPPEAGRLLEIWRRVKIDSTGFSDSYIMSFTLSDEEEHFAMRSLHTTLMASASAALLQLGAGGRGLDYSLPLRGGIDVGTGMKRKNDLYCSAMAKVAYLEKKADYPRILVGDGFRNMLVSYMNTSSSDPTGRAQASMATLANELLYQDEDDGLWGVDFMGKAFREQAGRNLSPTVIQDAWTFVKLCRDRHKDHAKHGPRYQRLCRYMEKRLPIWGVVA